MNKKKQKKKEKNIGEREKKHKKESIMAGLLTPVPDHLVAAKTKDSLSKKDINTANGILTIIYARLEEDREFPLAIKFPNVVVTERLKVIIRKHLGAPKVGYATHFRGEVLIIDQPKDEINEKAKDILNSVPPPYAASG